MNSERIELLLRHATDAFNVVVHFEHQSQCTDTFVNCNIKSLKTFTGMSSEVKVTQTSALIQDQDFVKTEYSEYARNKN